MINFNYENLPYSSQMLWGYINKEYKGNIKRFAKELGLENGQQIYRLFKIDKRNNTYPTPSIKLLGNIVDTFNLKIEDFFPKEEKTINNININTHNIKGNNNITNSNDVEMTNEDYIKIIQKQQEQIDKLIMLLSQK